MPQFRVRYKYPRPTDGHPNGVVVGAITVEAENEEAARKIFAPATTITSFKEVT